MTYTAHVRYIPAHFNRTAFCNVPARWTAEVVDLPDGTYCYSDGCQTREEAVSDLIAFMKQRGLSGKLRLIPA